MNIGDPFSQPTAVILLRRYEYADSAAGGRPSGRGLLLTPNHLEDYKVGRGVRLLF